MSELDRPFVQIGNRYFPTNAIRFEVDEKRDWVSIYMLGSREWVADVNGPDAQTLITNLNGMSIPLLPNKGER
jgi:hypothetical protein